MIQSLISIAFYLNLHDPLYFIFQRLTSALEYPPRSSKHLQSSQCVILTWKLLNVDSPHFKWPQFLTLYTNFVKIMSIVLIGFAVTRYHQLYNAGKKFSVHFQDLAIFFNFVLVGSKNKSMLHSYLLARDNCMQLYSLLTSRN